MGDGKVQRAGGVREVEDGHGVQAVGHVVFVDAQSNHFGLVEVCTESGERDVVLKAGGVAVEVVYVGAIHVLARQTTAFEEVVVLDIGESIYLVSVETAEVGIRDAIEPNALCKVRGNNVVEPLVRNDFDAQAHGFVDLETAISLARRKSTRLSLTVRHV